MKVLGCHEAIDGTKLTLSALAGTVPRCVPTRVNNCLFSRETACSRRAGQQSSRRGRRRSDKMSLSVVIGLIEIGRRYPLNDRRSTPAGLRTLPPPWASAHRGKWGQLTPGKIDEKLKAKTCQKVRFSTFMLYFESNRGRQV